MKKLLLLLIILLLPLVAKAHDIEVENAQGVMIYYVWTKYHTELAVSYQGTSFNSYSDEYSGELIIPESVVYNGNTYSVTSIGSNAFDGCSSLTSVTIPNSVTSIGEKAFESCSDLTSVNIPNSVTNIEKRAFSRCFDLTSVTIPNSVTSIGDFAFSSCISLTTIVVESGNPIYNSRNDCNAIIETATNKLVAGCMNTIIPSTVTSIGNGAFYGCSSLTSVIIPNSVTSIDGEAFSGCNGLTSVTIGNSVTSIRDDAFRDCSSLTSVTIPNSVTSIGAGAFYCCISLTTIVVESGNPIYDSRNDCNAIIETTTNTLVTGCMNTIIPSTVTSIGDSAFLGYSGLTSIEIPNSVTSIGNYAFYGCDGLTSVTIPISVTSIGSNAFYGCYGLITVTIPNSVTSIGADAFYLTPWYNNQPDGLIYAGKVAYKYKGTMPANTDIVIEDGTLGIAGNAFYFCSGLTSVTIPNTVTSIGSSAFDWCTGLTSVTIPNSVTSIGNFAFNGCSSLTSVIIPSSVMFIGEKAFQYCDGLTSATIGNSVTSIGRYAFYGCSGLTSVTIPNSVTSIGEWAFASCSRLTSVIVENDIPLQIDYYTFSNRDNATLYVPVGSKAAYEAADYWKEFKEIVERAPTSPIINFADDNVKSLCVANWDTDGDGELSEDEAAVVTTLGNVFTDNGDITSFNELQYFTGLTAIGDNAFRSCSLTSVTIPNSVTSIGENAFFGCVYLTSINIPNSVLTIGGGSFSGCSGLVTVTIGTSVESIGNSAFAGCDHLESLTIPNIVTSIGDNAFSGCGLMTSLTIGNALSTIGDEAFLGCSGLTSIVVDSENPYFDSRNNCNAIINSNTHQLIVGCQNTIIPESVTGIGDSAFEGCHFLTSITIPNSVTTIGEKAFYMCEDMTTCTIGSGVTSIGRYAFDTDPFHQYNNLTSVTVGFETPVSITSDVFPNRTNATLTVPVGCKGTFIAANYWKEFKEIVEMAPPSSNIDFADANVKALCADNWDTDGDGELSENEAASVTTLGKVFKKNVVITSFNELQHFTGLTDIGSEAFYGCSSLASVTIPNSVTSIGESAFRDCTGLTSVNIPNSVTSIGEKAFRNCSSLTSVTIPDNVTYIEKETFYGCSSLTSVTIPNSVTSIGESAFRNCIGLTSVTIPNSVTSIGKSAFRNCTGLTSVTIPNSVTSIGNSAFCDCSNLTSVIVETENPLQINSDAFSNRANATLYVPVGSKAAYEAAAYWQEFLEIKEIGTIELIPLTVGVEDVTVRLGSFIEDRPAVSFDFDNGESMFGWGNDQELGIVEGSYNGTMCQATTNPRQAEYWESQFAMDFDQLVPGEVYVLEFWAKANKSFWLNVCLQYPSAEAGWPSRGDFGWVEIGTEWQKFTLTTTVTGPDATRLLMSIGLLDGGTFYLDDILLRRKNPLFKLTYDGFVDGDDETTAFTTLPVASTTAKNDSPVGTYPITVSGGVSEKYSITYQPGTLTIFSAVKGDANGDGSVTIADAAAVVNYILGNSSANFNIVNANVNGDVDEFGNPNISITDAVGIVNIILNSSSSSGAPEMTTPVVEQESGDWSPKLE